MKTTLQLRWHNYRYFSYEKRLALREAQALGIEVIDETDNGIRAYKNGAHYDALSNLTYFSEVEDAEGTVVRSKQANIEESVGISKRRSEDSLGRKARQNKRQQTRYSAHGLHEYKGKFNPQIVRATANLIGLQQGDVLLDPFCGSGTTLVEANLMGLNAIGIDINPLGNFIANAKLSAMSCPPNVLRRVTDQLTQNVQADLGALERFDQPPSRAKITRICGRDWPKNLRGIDYLRRWLPEGVLAQLAGIESRIQKVRPKYLRDVYRVILSDIVRNVSWQDPGDLRIRRRNEQATNYPAVSSFVRSVQAKVHAVIDASPYCTGRQFRQVAYNCDAATGIGDVMHAEGIQRVDGIITSPPYATALPYIDTQRLSLIMLGLIEQQDLASTERSLIGTRELTKRERDKWEAGIDANEEDLPEEVHGLCSELLEKASMTGNGFRKRNTPALMYRYFAEMAKLFQAVRPHIKAGGHFALVVGPNTTSVGDASITIDTPRLLGQVGQKIGFEIAEMIDLDAYHRYGLHARNAIRAEQLVILRV